jgi:quercetin dioxygenase-like cupin family protein
MKIADIQEMKGGWFVGNFEPTLFSANFEVAVKKYKKGEFHAPHFHKIATEINYLISGRILANGTLIEPGQIFAFEPNEVASCEFVEDCELVVVKSVSVLNDKYEI